ncbi:ABC transporter ATP-binding protein [Spiroplasma endosymbiont of Aspidapion aeneum]|uniref:ABC transporter ATP-binding protein n=1 Tax=Spiroplasma endosymbiont of Aspidapion aeneum TaxID=3066276 RepID=UPI00313BDC9E
MIKIENVSKKYKENFVNLNININIEDGKIYGLIGPNGAGKTTLVRQMLGFIKSDEGKITFNNINSWNNSKKIMADIGYVPGELALFESVSVKYWLNLTKLFKENVDPKWVDSLVKYFDLDVNKKIKKLSKGNKQKVSIIGALMHKPKYIILDEPTSGLDPVMQIKFNKLILKLKNDYKTTVFLCSHIISESQELCDQIFFINHGNILKSLDSNEIKNNDLLQIFKDLYGAEL